MSEKITVRVITPEQKLFEKPADEILLTGSQGGFAVLPKRAPMVAELVPCRMTLRNDNDTEIWYITSGLVEVSDNNCNILVEFGVKSGEIDKSELTTRLTELKAKVAESKDTGPILKELVDHITFIELALTDGEKEK